MGKLTGGAGGTVGWDGTGAFWVLWPTWDCDPDPAREVFTATDGGGGLEVCGEEREGGLGQRRAAVYQLQNYRRRLRGHRHQEAAHAGAVGGDRSRGEEGWPGSDAPGQKGGGNAPVTPCSDVCGSDCVADVFDGLFPGISCKDLFAAERAQIHLAVLLAASTTSVLELIAHIRRYALADEQWAIARRYMDAIEKHAWDNEVLRERMLRNGIESLRIVDFAPRKEGRRAII